jgi:protein-tyrosine phosphatase
VGALSSLWSTLSLAARRRVVLLRATRLEQGAATLPAPGHDSSYAVLLVCHGNICRSPLAEAVLRERLARTGLGGAVRVESAGTSSANVGRGPDPRARYVAARHGRSIASFRARAFEPADLDRFDLVLAMDEGNRDAILAAAATDERRRKVRLFAERAVADPVDGRLRDFERAYAEIERRCDTLVAELAAAARAPARA